MQPTWSSHNNSGKLLHCCRCGKKPLLLMMLLQLLPGRRNRAVPAHSNTNAEGTLLNHLVTDCTPPARLVKTYHARKAAPPRNSTADKTASSAGALQKQAHAKSKRSNPRFFLCMACFSSAPPQCGTREEPTRSGDRPALVGARGLIRLIVSRIYVRSEVVPYCNVSRTW